LATGDGSGDVMGVWDILDLDAGTAFCCSATLDAGFVGVAVLVSCAYRSKNGSLPEDELLDEEVSEVSSERSEEEVVIFDLCDMAPPEFKDDDDDDDDEAGLARSGRIECRSFSFNRFREAAAAGDWWWVGALVGGGEAIDGAVKAVE